jgi:hypothetical protein
MFSEGNTQMINSYQTLIAAVIDQIKTDMVSLGAEAQLRINNVDPLSEPEKIERVSRIQLKPFGFWSQDSISLYVSDYSYGSSEIDISMSVSSGGRDTKETKNDDDAYANYARCILLVSGIAKTLRENTEYIRQFLDEERARWLAAQEAERKALEARDAANPCLGEKEAKKVMKLIDAHLKLGSKIMLKLFDRYNKDVVKTRIAVYPPSYGQRAKFYVGSSKVTDEDLMKALDYSYMVDGRFHKVQRASIESAIFAAGEYEVDGVK